MDTLEKIVTASLILGSLVTGGCTSPHYRKFPHFTHKNVPNSTFKGHAEGRGLGVLPPSSNFDGQQKGGANMSWRWSERVGGIFDKEGREPEIILYYLGIGQTSLENFRVNYFVDYLKESQYYPVMSADLYNGGEWKVSDREREYIKLHPQLESNIKSKAGEHIDNLKIIEKTKKYKFQTPNIKSYARFGSDGKFYEAKTEKELLRKIQLARNDK